ncbi:MAG: polysaccharide pyruvyl transferase family protein [Clostridiales bacterium]
MLKKCVGKRSIINYEGFMRKWQPRVASNINQFINTYIHRRIVNFESLTEGEYDAFIVGSDQVWRPSYNQHLEQAFLNFTENWKNVKRIAYAASFGVDNWEFTKKQTEECKRLVQKFDFVSVREDTAVNLCKEHLGIEATHVLDPTLLLSADDYQKLIDGLKISDSPYVFSYLLDESEEKIDILEDISKRLNLPVRKIKLEKDISKIPMSKLKSLTYPSIQEWLASFAQADFVVTDSFHGTVFSIIFNKPFVVLPNKGRGVARFESLLKDISLENRIFSDFLISDILYEEFPFQINSVLFQKSERIKLKIESLLC